MTSVLFFFIHRASLSCTRLRQRQFNNFYSLHLTIPHIQLTIDSFASSITIKDNGFGYLSKQIESLLEDFYQEVGTKMVEKIIVESISFHDRSIRYITESENRIMTNERREILSPVSFVSGTTVTITFHQSSQYILHPSLCESILSSQLSCLTHSQCIYPIYIDHKLFPVPVLSYYRSFYMYYHSQYQLPNRLHKKKTYQYNSICDVTLYLCILDTSISANIPCIFQIHSKNRMLIDSLSWKDSDTRLLSSLFPFQFSSSPPHVVGFYLQIMFHEMDDDTGLAFLKDKVQMKQLEKSILVHLIVPSLLEMYEQCSTYPYLRKNLKYIMWYYPFLADDIFHKLQFMFQEKHEKIETMHYFDFPTRSATLEYHYTLFPSYYLPNDMSHTTILWFEDDEVDALLIPFYEAKMINHTLIDGKSNDAKGRVQRLKQSIVDILYPHIHYVVFTSMDLPVLLHHTFVDGHSKTELCICHEIVEQLLIKQSLEIPLHSIFHFLYELATFSYSPRFLRKEIIHTLLTDTSFSHQPVPSLSTPENPRTEDDSLDWILEEALNECFPVNEI